MEPTDGLEMIYSEGIELDYRGAIVVTRRSLKKPTLDLIEDQEFTGVIAPSMDAGLIDQALTVPSAIILTQGFGETGMSPYLVQFLEELINKQATIDAVLPDRFETRRPEIVINLPSPRGERPATPDEDLILTVGSNVRMTRGDHAGVVGKISDLPKTPHLLENGLRVPCARVEMLTGKTAYVPLSNLEVFGQ
jgi:hypothetical protein